MAEQIVIKHCTADIKDRLQGYWQKKAGRIRRLLANFPEPQRQINFTIERSANRFEASLVVKLPSGNLVAKEEAKDPYSATDGVMDKLAREIKRHKGRLRHDELYRRKGRRQRLEEILPVLAEEKQRIDRDAFFDLLKPMLGQLHETARHEIIIAQLQGNLLPGDLTVSDVLDEVLLRAWEQFEDRAPHESLAGWLTGLLHQVIDARSKDKVADLSVYEEIAANDRRYSAEDGWVSENEPSWEQPVDITIDDMLPDEKTVEPPQLLEAEEQMRRLMARLSALPARQRRAFMLQAIDGWDEDEIAMIQGRSPEEIKQDIRKAREILSRTLKSSEDLQ